MNGKATRGGMGFVSTLTLIFVVLKLTGLLDWSWLWVLCPIWISGAFLVLLFGAILIAGRVKKGKW